MDTYEKKYKEIVGQIKKAYLYAQTDSTKAVLENIFPELKKSEDEKIRKSLLDYLHTLPNHFSHNGSIVIDWIAWLEKQGNLTDENMKELLRTEYEKGRADAFAQMQQGWSDKEKQMYADIIEATKKSGVFKEAYKRELVDFLNSLKDRYFWKPSDEQMEALDNFIFAKYPNIEKYEKSVKLLYNDLKKLKGE